MPKVQILKRPPIVEALIDIRAALPPGTDVKAFARLNGRLPEYPMMEEQRGFRAGLSVAPGSHEAHYEETGTVGYFFKSSDSRYVAQFRRDGFTLNRMDPYTNWKDLLQRAMSLWERFCMEANPQRVTRIAVRYVNRIEYSLSEFSPKDLLADPPTGIHGLRAGVDTFFDRTVLKAPREQAVLVLTRSNEQALAEGRRCLLVDVDAFRIGDFAPDRRTLENQLQVLRTLKNKAFFSTLSKGAIKRLNTEPG